MDVFTSLADRWGEVNDYLKNPVAWVQDKGESMWSKQREVLESIRDNRYTGVHACHGVGKSWISSRAIAWWIDSHTVGTAYVVSTAPTAAQVSSVVWREVIDIHRKAKLAGRITRSGYPLWNIDGIEVGIGRKPADYQDSAFQGLHSPHMLVIVDEACGVSRKMFDAVDALVTNDNARVLAIGNPDDPSSHFASICRPDSPLNSGWNIIRIDALRTPNMTREQVSKYPLLKALMEAENIPYSEEDVPVHVHDNLVNAEWVNERIMRWAGVSDRIFESGLDYESIKTNIQAACANSSIFTAKVRGLFPESATEGIIPLGWVQRSMERWTNLNADDRHASLKAHQPGVHIIGVDVARSGEDETVFAHRYGSHIERLERMHIADTMEIADRVAVYLHEPQSIAVIDIIGLGSGVYDALRRMKNQGKIVGTPVPFNAAKNSQRQDLLGEFKFLNDRAAAWWNMRELLDPSRNSNISLPNDENLLDELIAPKYRFNAGAHMVVESKDDIKKRLNRSTDSADAVLAAFWVSGSASNLEFMSYQNPPPGKGAGFNYDGYDPFTDEDMYISAGQSTMYGSSAGAGLEHGPGRWESNDDDWWA